MSSIRLTGTSYAVLGLIDLLGEATPYELKQAIEASVVNFWPVQHSTFYAEPTRLGDAGYLSVEQEEGGRRKKTYRLTDMGRKALKDWVASTEFNPPQLRDELVLKTFLGAEIEPLVADRVAWHEEKITELNGYLEIAAAGDGAPGVERAIRFGIHYHEASIRELRSPDS